VLAKRVAIERPLELLRVEVSLDRKGLRLSRRGPDKAKVRPVHAETHHRSAERVGARLNGRCRGNLLTPIQFALPDYEIVIAQPWHVLE